MLYRRLLQVNFHQTFYDFFVTVMQDFCALFKPFCGPFYVLVLGHIGDLNPFLGNAFHAADVRTRSSSSPATINLLTGCVEPMVVDDISPSTSPPSPSPQYAPFEDNQDRPNPIHASKKIRVALEPPSASSNDRSGSQTSASVKSEPSATPKTEHSSDVKSEVKFDFDSKEHVKSEPAEHISTISTSSGYTTTFIREQATFLRPSTVPSRTRCEPKRASVNSGYVPQMADGFKRNMHAEKSNTKR